MHESKKEIQTDKNSNAGNNDMSIWHWVIITGTTLGSILSAIIPHSFGTFIANFKLSLNTTNNPSFYNATQFQWDWLPALSSAIPCMFIPIFVIVVQKLKRSYQIISAFGFIILAVSCALSSLIETWFVLFFTYSFLYSIGSSLYLAVVIIILAEYFPIDHRYHVLATSLFQIGYPAAAFIGNPVFASVITEYGWQTSLRWFSLFEVLFGLIIALLMKPSKYEEFCRYSEDKSDITLTSFHDETFSTSKRSFSTTSLNYFATTYEIWPWLIGKFFNYLCWYGLRTNVVTYLVKTSSFGLQKSASLMSIYAAAEIMVALTASLNGDTFRGQLIHIHIISTLALTILTGIFTIAITSFLSAVILMICIGVAVQSSLNFGYPTSAEVLKYKFDMKTGWIYTNVAAGLGIFISPLFSGILMDKFNVKALFYAQCFGWATQVILFTITWFFMKYNENKSKSDYQEISLVE